MWYNYICDECGSTREIKASIKAKKPARLHCVECATNGKNSWMHRDWQNGGPQIHVPEWFKATSEEQDGNNPSNMSHLKDRIQHSRPSGKEKVYY